jgi:hypothetical protein
LLYACLRAWLPLHVHAFLHGFALGVVLDPFWERNDDDDDDI